MRGECGKRGGGPISRNGALGESGATVYGYRYEIRIEGMLSPRWADWFDGLAIRYHGANETILEGSLKDQAALLGVLGTLHGLNLGLISVERHTLGRMACDTIHGTNLPGPAR